MEYYAHTLEGRPPGEWQKLEDHLANVAGLAAGFAESFGAKEWGWIAGSLHDIGKASSGFQEYLRKAAAGNANLPRVDHSTLGARLAADEYEILGHLLAYVVSGHHSGLLDAISDSACLKNRLRKAVPAVDAKAMPVLESLPAKLAPTKMLAESFSQVKDQRSSFSIAFFVRMLFSALVDADFLDTEGFMNPAQAELRRRTQQFDFNLLFDTLIEYIDSLKKEDSPVNRARSEVLRNCIEAASEKSGFFSLTVPTGGGKTLASLAFALKHAALHDKSRIIYVIPFTSIIEQNASVFSDVFSPLGNDIVLEHHSNFIPEENHSENEESENAVKIRLASENWDARIIATTSVQFYESLFASRTSKCRKLHNIANSVVILDEAQTLPVRQLRPCLAALEELVHNYGCSVVLCTATQPEIAKRDNFPIGIPRNEMIEIIPDRKTLHVNLKRVESSFIGLIEDDALAARIAENARALCIVNTRRHARSLFEKTRAIRGGNVYHLSALMCPVHRSEVLAEIKDISENEPCVLISTQLIEAGVDIDFPVVFRSLAGIDSIAQAAGRCNRNGRLPGYGKTFIFKSEHKSSESYFSETANVTAQVMELHDDPLSLEAVERFFRLYYWEQSSKWDAKNIMSNFKLVCDQDLPFIFNFAETAKNFRLIENNQMPVVIPYGEEGAELAELARRNFPNKLLSRRLQRYTVNLNKFIWEKAKDRLFTVEQNLYPILTSLETCYSPETGLDVDGVEDGAAFCV